MYSLKKGARGQYLGGHGLWHVVQGWLGDGLGSFGVDVSQDTHSALDGLAWGWLYGHERPPDEEVT